MKMILQLVMAVTIFFYKDWSLVTNAFTVVVVCHMKLTNLIP